MSCNAEMLRTSDLIAGEPKSTGYHQLAVVTGAARRVGSLIALHLAAKGYAVVLHYHSSKLDAEKIAAEIIQSGGQVHLVQADLTRPDEIVRMFSVIDALPGELKILVNSAALMIPSDLAVLDVERWDKLMNLNTRAVWLCSREAAKRMPERGFILNISDVGAGKNWTRYGGYVISKAAVESLTKILARQFAPRVRVCAVAPGLLMRAENQPLEEWKKLAEKVPMKRTADTAELLAVLDFLVDNDYITGEVISLSGGYHLV